MLPPNLQAVLLVALTGLQLADARRSAPPKVDLRSGNSPVPAERLDLLPNAINKLSHIVEDVSSLNRRSNTPPVQPPFIEPAQVSQPQPPTTINPRSAEGEIGSETIPSNPSNIITSLLCNEAFPAEHGNTGWGNYLATMEIIEEVGKQEAVKGKWGVKKQMTDGGTCKQVGCRGGSGVWWCGVDNGPAEVDRMFSILWGANYILEECSPFVDRQDAKGMSKTKVAGKAVFAGGWEVVVKSGPC